MVKRGRVSGAKEVDDVKWDVPGEPAVKHGTSFQERRRVFTSTLRSLTKATAENSPFRLIRCDCDCVL